MINEGWVVLLVVQILKSEGESIVVFVVFVL